MNSIDSFYEFLLRIEEARVKALFERGFKLAKLEHSDVEILAHNPNDCLGPACTLHNRSNHHMRSWKQHWRQDKGIMERICPHGIGHPDPDSPWDSDDGNWIHGCDGCC